MRIGLTIIKVKHVCFQIFAAFLLSSELAWGGDWVPDLKWGLIGRSYPVGAQFIGSAGVSVPIWGDTQKWKYGFARIALNGATSAVVNRVGAEIQLFPVSILGVSAGFDSGVRSFRPRFVDCQNLECEGRVDRAYLRGQMFFGMKNVFLNFNVRYEGIHSYESGRPFFDEMNLIWGRNYGETILQYNPLVLYRLNSVWMVGGISLYTRALDSGGSSHLYGPVVVWSEPENWSIAGGLGFNQSSLVQRGVSLFFSAQMTIEPSLQIGDLSRRKRNYSSLF
jgi:hypothetical protein